MKFNIIAGVIALALNAQSRNLQQTNTITNLIDKNCLKYDANTGDCIQCSYRSIFKNKKCQQISPYCQTWNSQTGQCLTCYIGYKLDKETCIIEIQNTNQNQSGGQNQNNGQNQNQNSSQNTQIPLNQRDAYNTIEGCLKLTADGLACQTCQPRRVKISGNNCLKVSDLCKQWSQSNGDCTQCYPSYKISQGKCIYDNSMDNINGQNQTGGNQNGGQNQTGGNQNGGQNQTGGNQNGGQNQTGGNQNSGQNQTGGQGSEIDANSIVQGCIQLQADKINCAKCQFRRIKISGTNCQKVSDDCNTWNQVNGACQSCYQGYKVQNGQCVLDAQYQNGGQNQTGGNQNGGQNQTGGNQNGGQNQTGGNQNSGQNQTGGQGSEIDANSIVQGCIQLQADKINCAKCQFRRIKISGTNCQKVSDDCNTWNQVNGACQSCYQGYKVQNGQCVVQVTQVV